MTISHARTNWNFAELRSAFKVIHRLPFLISDFSYSCAVADKISAQRVARSLCDNCTFLSSITPQRSAISEIAERLYFKHAVKNTAFNISQSDLRRRLFWLYNILLLVELRGSMAAG